METLFNFTVRRPPTEQADETPSIQLEQDTSFQQDLEDATNEDEVRDRMKDVARGFVANGDFLADTIGLFDGTLDALGDELDQLDPDGAIDHEGLVERVDEIMHAPPSEIVEDDEFDAAVSRLRDSIIAIKLLPEEQHRPVHKLTRALRDLEVIQQTAIDEEFPQDAPALRRYRRRSLIVPSWFKLDSVLRPATNETQEEPDIDDQIDERLDHFTNLVGAIEELTEVSGDALIETPSEESDESLPPRELRPRALFSDIMRPPRGDNDDIADALAKHLLDAHAVLAETGAQRIPFSGRPGFSPIETDRIGFRLTEGGVNALSQETRNILEDLDVDPTLQPLDDLVTGLCGTVRTVIEELDSLGGRQLQRSLKWVGDTPVVITTPKPSPWADISVGTDVLGDFLPRPTPNDDPTARVPTTSGDIAPAGVADLYVVKQQLTGYESVDIAHIENVLLGEGKLREHRRRREIEELFFRETEVTTEEEHDLQSTTRFEMVEEVEETINEEASLKAGLTVTAKYGPAVEVEASAEGSMSRTRERAKKTASTFSKEITERSAKKITERVLERESRRVTTEIDERNEHTLDNVDGDDHVVGVYQWLEKVYAAQLFNYGLRTMYDFMVPEPGAFLIEALRRSQGNTEELEKPILFALRPDQITEYNYPFWVQAYAAEDVAPPPEPYRTKSAEFSQPGGEANTDHTTSGQIQIDDGYRAVHGSAGTVVGIWEEDYFVDVVLGQRTHRFELGQPWVWSTPLDGERDSIPFALNTAAVSSIGFAVEVKCQRTCRAMDQWRYDTHAALTRAYRARKAEYEEKLAALEAEADSAIEGQNPGVNRELMMDEMKKACVSILTGQHFELFGAIETGEHGFPQIDLTENEAEGVYVRFFEQAFEWEHMTWVTYPYFWSRKTEWTDRIGNLDSDPIFNQFLKAGYCRVSVPLREGFENAVDHFMTTGEPWMGGPLPPIGDDLYVPIADELAEQLDRPGDEVPEGDPWEIRLPTSLVHLREDGNLPQWENVDGEWISVRES